MVGLPPTLGKLLGLTLYVLIIAKLLRFGKKFAIIGVANNTCIIKG